MGNLLLFFLSVLALFLQQSSSILQEEVEVLLDLKSKLQPVEGVEDTLLNGWPQSNASMACDWKGVTCDPSKQHIVKLQLGYLRGTITPLLGRLEQLEEFHLNLGLVQGTIPRELGNCTKLRVLSLSFNRLEGPIPPELGSCTELQSLDLSENSLEGPIPPELGSCTELQSLDLSENSLEGPIPPELGNCTGLQSLYLFDNKLEGAIPPELLRSCTRLQSLGLSLAGAIPPSLANLSALENLALVGNELDCQSIPRLPQVTKIHLSCNTTFANVSLGQCPKLWWIDLHVRGGTGAPPNWLASWKGERLEVYGEGVAGGASFNDYAIATNVTRLALSGLNLSDEVPAALLSQLQFLDLSDNQLSSIQAAGDGTPTRLLRLKLSNNRLTHADLARLTTMKHANLTYLYMSFNKMEGQVPYSIATSCPSLQFLSLDNNALVGNLSWATQLPYLDVLDLSYNNFSGSLPPLQPGWDLDLSHNNLSGPIPHSILSRTLLDLSHNRLTGQLPSENSILLGIEHLDLSHNNVSGPIPHNIISQVLEYLDLSHNRFTGHLPSEISQASAVQMINLAFNELEGSLPLDFPRGTFQLDLSNNRFSGSIPRSLCDLPGLSGLSLAGNWLKGSIPDCIANSGQLNILDLSVNSLSGQLPPNLDRFASKSINNSYRRTDMIVGFNGGPKIFEGDHLFDSGLVLLDVSSNQLGGEIPAELGKSTHMIELNLAFNSFTGNIPSELGNLTNLQALDLNHNQLQGSIPQELCSPPRIGLLNVSYNNLSGTVPSCNGIPMDTRYSEAFDGNAFLCGHYVNNSGCQHKKTHTDQQQHQHHHHQIWLFKLVSPWAFYIGLVVGFYITFLPMLFYRVEVKLKRSRFLGK